MLGNFEKRRFADGKKVWLGRYRNLTNVLHWHFECELIRIVKGNAQIKIGSNSFEGAAGDAFFCGEEQLHYILSTPGSEIEVAIFDRSITKDITERCSLISPKLPAHLPVEQYLRKIASTAEGKGLFYRETLESLARVLVLEIFRGCDVTDQRNDFSVYNKLIGKIHDEFAFITFADAASYCGYSPSHFSKTFKRLSGINFQDYLNKLIVRNNYSNFQ